MPQLAAARLALAVAYPLLAHWASHAGGPPAAALALGDLTLIVLLHTLVRGRAPAWAAFVAACAALYAGRNAPWLPMLLLAPPVLFTGALGWLFARTLRPGRTPLITRIAATIEYGSVAQMPPEQLRYTRGLTAIWAGLLIGIAVANGVLAVIAQPAGVLAQLGHPLAVGVSQQAWSWFANLIDYGLVGGFFVIEFIVRARLFPDRPIRGFAQFMRRLAALGPDFWRHLPD